MLLISIPPAITSDGSALMMLPPFVCTFCSDMNAIMMEDMLIVNDEPIVSSSGCSLRTSCVGGASTSISSGFTSR